MDVMKSSADSSVYMVDETYHLIYYNEVLQDTFPEIKPGDFCYRAFCGNSSPCRACPLAEGNADVTEMYNEKLKCWVELSTGRIEWPGQGTCSIIISRNIPEHKLQEAERSRISAKGINSLTGLYKKSRFFQAAEEFLKKTPAECYCLVAIDVEHFKLFNEWYGKKAGDAFLLNIANCLREIQKESGGVTGYMGEDDFCILLPCGYAHLEHLKNRILGYIRQYKGNAGFLPAFGVYEFTDRSVPVSMMYDRAVIAISFVKGNYADRMCRFDALMMQEMEENHVMLSEVQRGLENGEFTFYLQPKCNMATGRIVGVESLVRWLHPNRGLVTPGEFVPLLERSGFIAKLDMYIWNQVCRYLRKWLDEGKELLPVSVNVSRVDIYTLDVVEYFKNLVRRYSIPLHLLEIEITESAYAEEYQKITAVAEQLRSTGFTVLMDDFGSGYSSLNMLKDINVDVLKIDMKFLDMNEQSADKGLGILEAIIRMAALMGLRIIAEGVETEEQVRFLVEMGCLYGQGYYFYQPLSIERYENLLEKQENFDYRGIRAREIKNLSIKDLMNTDIFSETMMHNILGGIGFYKVSGSNVELLKVNEYYYKVTGSNPIDLEEQRSYIQKGVHEDDQEEFLDIFKRADHNRLNGGCGQIRRICDNGSVIWVQLHAFFLKAQEDGRLYYGAVTDVTEQRRREQNQELDFLNNNMPGGYHRCSTEPGHEFIYISNRFLEIFGYTREEIRDLFGNRFMNMVHPDDRVRVENGVCNLVNSRCASNFEYRMRAKNGYIWVIDQSRYTEYSGSIFIQGVVLNVTEMVELRNMMKIIMGHTPDNILFLKGNNGVWTYEVAADGISRQVGYPAEEYLGELLEASCKATVLEDGTVRLGGALLEAVEKKEEYQNIVQAALPGGEMRWFALNVRYICQENDQQVLLCIFGDVTFMKEKEHDLWMSGQKMKSILRQAKISSWEWNMKSHSLDLGNIQENSRVIRDFIKTDSDHLVIENFPDVMMGKGVIPDAYEEKLSRYLEEMYRGGKRAGSRCEIPLHLKDKSICWVRMACELVEDENGSPVVAIGYYYDITKEKEERIQSRENMKTLQVFRSQALYDFKVSLSEAVSTCSGGRLKNWMGETGCSQKQLLEGATEYFCSELILPRYQDMFRTFTDKKRMYQAYRDGKVMESLDYQRMYRGTPCWMRMLVNYTRSEENDEVYAYIFVTDIDEQKKQELHLAKMAETDAMTGLYNRRTARSKIEGYLKNRQQGSAAVIMFDMDNFKTANDVFGHAYGDSMIRENAEKLNSFFRENDIICRMGGDEFLVLCRDIKEDAVNEKLRRILSDMAVTYHTGEKAIKFSVSAGYAMVPDQGTTFEELYRKADIALFTAKMNGKSTFLKYDSSMKDVRLELADRKKPRE